MIDKETVKRLVEERFAELGEDLFIVDISINERNVINIFIDGFDGVTIQQCVSVSRNVEHNLDREEVDFELHVSSPGLTQGFVVKEQYIKYTGKNVEVVTTASDKKLEGVLLEVGEEGIVLETSGREKVEGHKKKQLVVKKHNLKYDEIKSTKAVVSFK
jgi:ribosome maturation factor RimP